MIGLDKKGGTMDNKVQWNLSLVRFTKGHKGLYKDRENHNIYLTQEEMKILGDTEKVVVTITKAKEV